ncbi:coproporphyrinogen III oxidase [Ruminiclostridium hungatei]|uniref:Coproporphyrinogen III oxidase n=1 Tax=Ruminiclostridium hungatei TaxID=48256 RepID=A0A1V4SQX8_RUMHU|nr:B12-binding domain-containing radical SAM protein [Ruminiclostridium hungatei]OPX46254.1 coproporphyrinogen III oxidase [Ruminiclostridium hungatei]
MKTLLVGINSKFIHTCLAVWYLKANLGEACDCTIREFTINDSKDTILSEIFLEKPDILAFSCYIWNMELVGILTRELKKLLPRCRVILGGPEVSYNAGEILEANEAVDFVLCGEGEEIFPVLIQSISYGGDKYKTLNGIAFREGDGEIVFRPGFNLVAELDRLKSPYTSSLLAAAQNRIVYFESSRGCPFSCSYCISSTFNGVRYFSFQRVREELERLLEHSPKLIKFVDRTFNCNRSRAKEIFMHIINLDCPAIFHFEAAADLFDEELLELLSRAPKGRIQLEIGLQTTNPETLEEICRVTDLRRLKRNVYRILANGNIHVHLDLIAGLPFESMASFRNSFNEVYAMRPHQLQLGFLKMLKGSKIREEADKHGYSFRAYTPYEILGNSYISYDEILVLKDVEETLERFFNSGRYLKSLGTLEQCCEGDVFELYRQLSAYCRKNGYLNRPVAYRENITVLYKFAVEGLKYKVNIEEFRQNMVFDFLSSDSSCSIPEVLSPEEYLLPSERVHELLRNKEFVKEHLPHLTDLPAKNILKKVFFVSLGLITGSHQLLLFDYTQKDPVCESFRSVVFKKLIP